MRTLFVILLLSLNALSVRASELKLSLLIDKTTFYRGQKIGVWLVSENATNKPLIVRPENSEALAVAPPLVVTNDDGQPVHYAGSVVQLATGYDGVQIYQPREKRVVLVDFDHLYDVRAEGLYDVVARIEAAKHDDAVLGPYLEKHPGAIVMQGTAESNKIRFSTLRLSDAAEPVIRRCLAGRGLGWSNCIRRILHGDQSLIPKEPEYSTLMNSSLLAPYVELALVNPQPFHGKTLAQWYGQFMARYPDFDQPTMLAAALASKTDQYMVDQLDELRRRLSERREIDPSHPVFRALNDQRQRLVRSREEHEKRHQQ